MASWALWEITSALPGVQASRLAAMSAVGSSMAMMSRMATASTATGRAKSSKPVTPGAVSTACGWRRSIWLTVMC